MEFIHKLNQMVRKCRPDLREGEVHERLCVLSDDTVTEVERAILEVLLPHMPKNKIMTLEQTRICLIESINDRDDYDADHYFLLWKEALEAEKKKRS
jgi:hypothetical protein